LGAHAIFAFFASVRPQLILQRAWGSGTLLGVQFSNTVGVFESTIDCRDVFTIGSNTIRRLAGFAAFILERERNERQMIWGFHPKQPMAEPDSRQ
jgi:hypothetical protein